MSPHLQLEQATAQLRCAAAIAEQRALGDPRDPWSAMAGTILLIATGLDPMPSEVSVQAMELHGHLEAALAALDEIPADEEPTGLAFWRAHVADLEANAHTLEARAAVANGSDS